MSIKKLLIGAATGAMILAFAMPAIGALKGDLINEQWRIFNVKPDTASFWDINKVKTDDEGSLTFPIQEFKSTSTGSFAVYLMNNYNVDLTGKTLEANMSWTEGTYKTRREVDGAYVRFWFQDVTSGPYDSNDYWWSTVNCPLNSVPDCNLEATLTNRSLWTNQSGKSANDTTEDWLQWQGDIVHMSPYDGFTRAMKNVKQMGLSFGNASSYASGVALYGSEGTFTVQSFIVSP